MFDSFVDVKEGIWRSFESVVPQFEFNKNAPYFELIVPTVDTVRLVPPNRDFAQTHPFPRCFPRSHASLLDTLLGIERPVFFTGVSGVGKSVIVGDFFMQAEKQNKVRAPIAYPPDLAANSLTHAMVCRRICRSSCRSRRKRARRRR